jgi:hypothetical protein
LVVTTTEHPPLRATPYGGVLPITLLADKITLLLCEANEFLVLLALYE